METSEKIIREAAENQEGSPAYYKRAILECLAEIQATVERIHRSIDEREKAKDESGKLIAQLLDETEKRIQQRQQENSRLESEIAALRAKLQAA
ncbi:MAG: hypothetical protein AB7U82_30230 [Blastocatellales bacterium]